MHTSPRWSWFRRRIENDEFLRVADEERVKCGCRHQSFGVRRGRPLLRNRYHAEDLLVPKAQLRKHFL